MAIFARKDKLKSFWRNPIRMSQGPLWAWRERTRKIVLHLEKCRVQKNCTSEKLILRTTDQGYKEMTNRHKYIRNEIH